MASKKISVVIPIYNSANHLKTTFDSLSCQTMDKSDFEIICVDDCSTDNSREVIGHFATTMPNVKLISLPVNTGGPMIPRNTGIDAAEGRYIHFMDGDDFLGEESLERLYKAAEMYQSDVVFGRHIGVNGRPVPTSMFYKGNLPKASLLTDNLVYSLAPHKMIRTSLLKTYGFKFVSEAKAGNEDQLFIMQCYVKARVISVLDDYDYYFIVARGNENLSRQVHPADVYFFVPHQVMKFTNEQVSDPELRKKIKRDYIDRVVRKDNFPRHLFDPAFPVEKKREWLQEGKKFLDAYMDEEQIRIADPATLEITRIVQANDLKAIEDLAAHKTNGNAARKRNPQVNLVMPRSSNIQVFTRPSVNAIPANTNFNVAKRFPVYTSIKGWFEVRQTSKEGGTYALFVQQKDVRYSLNFTVRLFVRRMKSFLKNNLLQKNKRAA